MPVKELREHIRLMLTPDTTLDRDLVERMGGAGWSRAALAGAFAVAVDRRFPSPPSRQEVAELVERVRTNYVRSEALPPMLGEALVRSGFGEESLLDGMSDQELTQGQALMTYGIVLGDLGLRGGAYEEYLTEAAKTAQEFLDQTSS